MKRPRSVYLDHAATTPVDKQVFEAMQPFFSTHFGNPSALYKEAQIANGALNDARRTIAEALHAMPDNIVFTSGGTEANNLALFGVARTHAKHGKHIITVATEHHAVLEPLAQLKKEGWKVTALSVDKKGFVKVEDVFKALRPDTVLISIMYANNEIGTVQPIADIGRQLLRYRKEHKTRYPFFHTDACQAAGYLNLDVEKLHVDLMTVNGSKIYGPKGAGFLYVRRGVKLQPIVFGGSQERNLRSGTENVPGAVGLARALEICQKLRSTRKIEKLSEYFWKLLQKKVPSVELNGPEIGEGRLPNNLNIVFPGIDGEALVIYLDSYGVMCSTGSACTAVSREPSHVLKAIGRNKREMLSSMRFTLGRGTTKQDIDYAIHSLQKSLKLVGKSSG
ncbi:MAG: cysteine desulfurase [Candidatus Magasanikbacteria bacterium]|nr:cysteine desulfurase [Candidatus Magasanikbacteria bacterium]